MYLLAVLASASYILTFLTLDDALALLLFGQVEQDKKDAALRRELGKLISHWFARCHEEWFNKREPPPMESVRDFKCHKEAAFRQYCGRSSDSDLELYTWHYPYLVHTLGGIAAYLACDVSVTEQQVHDLPHAQKHSSCLLLLLRGAMQMSRRGLLRKSARAYFSQFRKSYRSPQSCSTI